LEAGEDNDLFSDSVDERPVPTRSWTYICFPSAFWKSLRQLGWDA
jgi:hypothetical protein